MDVSTICPKSAEKTEDWEAGSVTSWCDSDTRFRRGFLLACCPGLHFVSTLTKCHTFHFLLLSLIPLTVYVQIETADKNLRMETHLIPNSARRQRLKTDNSFSYLKCACGRAAASLLMTPVQTEEGQTKRCVRVKRRTKWRRGCNQC